MKAHPQSQTPAFPSPHAHTCSPRLYSRASCFHVVVTVASPLLCWCPPPAPRSPHNRSRRSGPCPHPSAHAIDTGPIAARSILSARQRAARRCGLAASADPRTALAAWGLRSPIDGFANCAQAQAAPRRGRQRRAAAGSGGQALFIST